LHLLEDLDRDNVEARRSVDEIAVNGDAADSGRAQEGNCAKALGGDRMILLIEANLVGRPPQPGAVYA
jgi:hypothetical protein